MRARNSNASIHHFQRDKVLGGFLPSGGGIGNFLGKESPTDRLLAILHSRTLAMEVIQSLDLLPILFAKKLVRPKATMADG